MPTYDIYVKKTGTERHSVEAASPRHAYELYEAGDAHLKDDENDGVDSVTIVDRATGEAIDADALEDEPGEPEIETREYRVRIRATALADVVDSWTNAISHDRAPDRQRWARGY